jgi:hypothetical protein
MQRLHLCPDGRPQAADVVKRAIAAQGGAADYHLDPVGMSVLASCRAEIAFEPVCGLEGIDNAHLIHR